MGRPLSLSYLMHHYHISGVGFIRFYIVINLLFKRIIEIFYVLVIKYSND